MRHCFIGCIKCATAPVGSATAQMRPTSGTSCGGTKTDPPQGRCPVGAFIDILNCDVCVPEGALSRCIRCAIHHSGHIPTVHLEQRVGSEGAGVDSPLRPAEQAAEECAACPLVCSDELVPDERTVVSHSTRLVQWQTHRTRSEWHTDYSRVLSQMVLLLLSSALKVEQPSTVPFRTNSCRYSALNDVIEFGPSQRRLLHDASGARIRSTRGEQRTIACLA